MRIGGGMQIVVNTLAGKIITLDVEPSDIINMDSCVRGGMQIFVQTLYKKVYTLDVVPSDTIDEVKAKLHNKADIPVREQRLIFEGRELVEYDHTLSDYKIQKGSELHLLMKGFEPLVS